jgi:hypothetical protein
MKTTELEKRVLRGIAGSDYFDGYLETKAVWTFSIWTSDVRPEQRSGVVSSLVKKGIVTVETYEHDNDCIRLTNKGVKLVIELGYADEFNLWYEGKDKVRTINAVINELVPEEYRSWFANQHEGPGTDYTDWEATSVVGKAIEEVLEKARDLHNMLDPASRRGEFWKAILDHVLVVAYG